MTLYNLLLRVYPASFRNEYGGEMRAVFARRRRQASTASGIVALWAGTIPEVLGNALLVHADILRQDLAYTGRMLRRAPGFAVTALLIVALGIGATTAVFSVTDFVLLRPLPFPNPERLVKLYQRTPGYPRMELTAPNYRDWKSAARLFESMAVYHAAAMTMTTRGEPRQFLGTSVSAELFPTLGVVPAIGRTFTGDDDREGAPGTVILSYPLWQGEFGGDPEIVGRKITFDSIATGTPAQNVPYTVIGVMPQQFHFPESDSLFWITNRFGEQDYTAQERTNSWLIGIGRLPRGVTLDQARAELEVIAARLAQQYPKENKNIGASVSFLSDEVPERSRVLLIALSGAAACVLLIACANLANLLLARALARRRELAVRGAMGAGRERLVRQLMTESLLLAGLGGVLGVGIAALAVPLLTQLIPMTLPIAASPSVDRRILTFAIALTALTGIGFGLAPVLRIGRRPDLEGLRDGMRAGGGQKERLRSLLVVGEIMTSVVLLASAGLLIRALLTIQRIDPGFNRDQVLTMRTALPVPQYSRVATRDMFYSTVLREVRSLPGVKNAAYVTFLPMSTFRGGIWSAAVKGDASAGNEAPPRSYAAALRYVTPGYFDTLGIPLKRGRDVSDADTQARPFSAVVSESFVRRFWPNEDPIGRHFTFAFADREVVGVVGDVRFRGLEGQSEPQVYLPYQQVADGSITFYAPKELAVRTSVPPASLAPAVREVIRRVDPRQPVMRVQTLSDIIDLETASRSVQVRVLSAFAVVAFILAAVGIHGLLSFAVSQRLTEIGVRMALGARPSDIVSMVTRRCALLALGGIVPGVFLAYVAGRSMEALLAGVRPADAMTLGAAIVLSVLMTVLGSLVPTLRAVRIDPMTALRAE